MLPLTTIAYSAQFSFVPSCDGAGGRVPRGSVAIDFFMRLWHQWEPPGVVFLSLCLQVFLIIMGRRRRLHRGRLSTFSTWIAYLSADAVAVYAIGIITTRIARAPSPKHDLCIQLYAFWAPFLLLHLGGPETITAYSLEDNELWLRHLLSLCTQTGMSLYIFFTTWNGSALSFLTVGMMLAGLIKYGERVCVLWFASSEKFRRSVLRNSRLISSQVTEEQKLMMAEGFHVVPHRVNEVPHPEDFQQSNWENDMFFREELLMAVGLMGIVERLFADLSFLSRDHVMSLAMLQEENCLSAFRIIEIELGLMFDVLYTKAKVTASVWGAISRSASILITVVVMVIFSLLEAHRKPYSQVDLGTTYVLLGGAIFLEGYALTMLALSDKAASWLIWKRKLKAFRIINMLQPLSKRRRWSRRVGQFSILSYSLGEKQNCWLLRLIKIEMINKHIYKSHKDVTDDLKLLITKHFLNQESTIQESPGDRLHHLRSLYKWSLEWSTKLDFQEMVVVWHIATELILGFKDYDKNHDEGQEELSLILSRYMIYLFIFHPSMLQSNRIASLEFKDTYIEAMNFINRQRTSRKSPSRKEKLTELCQNVTTELNVTIVKEDRSKFVLFHGCRLWSQLDKIGPDECVEIMREVWIEIAAHAARHCRSSYHCKELKMGGQLLTHIWLLMAHFGWTPHFQKQEPSVAELVVT